jgi:tetratricopeptide (TPR) repeat protein
MRPVPTLLAFGILVFGCAASPPPRRRPKVDVAAMREAMEASRPKEKLSSGAAYSHFLVSRLAHFEGDSRRAVSELQLALATDEGNPYLLTKLAEEYVRLGDLGRAESELRKVLERQSDYHPAQLLMGKVLADQRRFTRAKVHLRQAVRLQPRDPEAYLALAEVALSLGAPEEAVRVVEELAQALPGEPTGFKRLGLAFGERGDLPRAEAMLEKATARDPGDFESWALLAQLYQLSGKLGRSEAAFDRALERDPDNREVLLQAGRVSLAQGSVVRARAYFDRLLSLSGEAEWTLKVAYAYLGANKAQEAQELLEQARTFGPHPKISFSSGLVLERQRRFVLAAEAYAEVPEGHELFDEARLRRALCLSQAGLHLKAIGLFEQGRKARPDYLSLYAPYAQALERAGRAREATTLLEDAAREHAAPELLDALAQLYERQGRKEDAVRLLLRAVAEHPKDEDLLYVLGATYERQGELDKALERMRAVLVLNPKNAQALNFIGYTLADHGRDLDEAERLLTRALELRPDSGAFLDSMGWLHFRRGEFHKAVLRLERAVERIPDDPLVREHLGDAYRAAGRKEKAAEAYRQALEDLEGPEAPAPEAARVQREGLLRKLKFLGLDGQGR